MQITVSWDDRNKLHVLRNISFSIISEKYVENTLCIKKCRERVIEQRVFKKGYTCKNINQHFIHYNFKPWNNYIKCSFKKYDTPYLH